MTDLSTGLSTGLSVIEDDRARRTTTSSRGQADGLMIGRGRVMAPRRVTALVAELDDERVGVLTYVRSGSTVEVVTLTGARPGLEAELALLDALTGDLRPPGTRRLHAVVTNDDVEALRLYQQAGFRLVALRPRAIERRRRLDPAIPAHGVDGIPVRDELELLRVL
jgi:ribosomal protein S18 acetylase RimI-like enzyme